MSVDPEGEPDIAVPPQCLGHLGRDTRTLQAGDQEMTGAEGSACRGPTSKQAPFGLRAEWNCPLLLQPDGCLACLVQRRFSKAWRGDCTRDWLKKLDSAGATYARIRLALRKTLNLGEQILIRIAIIHTVGRCAPCTATSGPGQIRKL